MYITDLFKKRLKELGLNSTIHANNSGCLDACEHCVTFVVYQEPVWYCDVSLYDVEDIIQEHIVKNKPV